MARQLGIMKSGFPSRVAEQPKQPTQSERVDAWGVALEALYVRNTNVPVYEIGQSVTVDIHAVDDGHKHMGTEQGKVIARGTGNHDDIYMVKLSTGHICVAGARMGKDGKPANMKGIHESMIDNLDEENEGKLVKMFLNSHK